MNLHDVTPEDILLDYLRARYNGYEWVPATGGYDYRTPAGHQRRAGAWLQLRGETIMTTDMRQRADRWVRNGRPPRPTA